MGKSLPLHGGRVPGDAAQTPIAPGNLRALESILGACERLSARAPMNEGYRSLFS